MESKRIRLTFMDLMPLLIAEPGASIICAQCKGSEWDVYLEVYKGVFLTIHKCPKCSSNTEEN